MAYFKLDLLTLNTPKRGTQNVSYLASTISEFYTQRDEYLSGKPTDYSTPARDYWASGAIKQGTEVPLYDANGEVVDPKEDEHDRISVGNDSKLVAPIDYVTNHIAGRKNTFCYSENERISFHQNSQIDFSFSLNEKIFYHDQWITNPFIHALTPGAQLLLTDKDGDEHLLTVKQVQLTFKNNNTTYAISCQDSFSYQSARQNHGYTIKNDSSSEDFIGAKTLDWWADKIKTDCNMVYDYLPMQQGLYLSNSGLYKNFKASSVNGKVSYVKGTAAANDESSLSLEINDLKKVIKEPYTTSLNADYFESFPFSVSGSTASAALISAAETLDMNLVVFEKSYFDEYGQMYFLRYFWFEPKKNADRISGLVYRPSSSIQNFGLSFSGAELSSVLDVEGVNRDSGELVTLLPQVSPFFVNLFNSKLWETKDYYKGFFSDICNGDLLHLTNKNAGGLKLLSSGKDEGTNKYKPCEQKAFNGTNYSLIKIDDWKGKLTNLYNRVGFAYYDQKDRDTSNYSSQLVYINADAKSIISFANLSAWKFVIESKTGNAEKVVDDYFIYSSVDEIPSSLLRDIEEEKDSISLYIALPIDSISFAADDYDVYIYFFRNSTDEDRTFAAIADECPWLENKLIDLNYFLKHNLISKAQFTDINNILNNNLRRVNGKLLLYSNEYYAAVRKKTNTIAELTSQLDSLGAAAQGDLIDPFARVGSIQDSEFFESSYKTAFRNIGSDKKEPLVGFDDLITYYGNKYFDARQRFLKNVYNFRNFFNAPNLRYSGSKIAVGDITASVKYPGMVDSNGTNIILPGTYNWISFKESDFNPQPITTTFPFVLDNGYSSVPIYGLNTQDGTYSLMTTVNAGNVKDFYEVKSYLRGEGTIPYTENISYNSAQTYWLEEGDGDNKKKTILPLGPYVDKDTPTIADRFNTANLTEWRKEAGDTAAENEGAKYFIEDIYQRDDTNNYSNAKECWPRFYERDRGLITTSDRTWLSSDNKYTGWYWNLFSYTLMQDYVKEDNEFTRRLASIPGAGENFKTAFNNVFKNTQDIDSRYSAEAYAANLPVSSLYIYDKDDKEYKEVPYVTPSNNNQYYRYTTGLSKFDYFNTQYSWVAPLVSITWGIALPIIAKAKWRSQVQKSSLDTEGRSSLDISKTRFLKTYYEGWSLDQSTLWYVKDKDSVDKLKSVGSGSTLTYSNFYSLVAPTYSYITNMPTESDQREVGVSTDFDYAIYNNAYDSRKNYYFKDSWLRPLALTDKVNKQDNYYICMLGSEKFTDTAPEATDVILNGGIINPLPDADGLTKLQTWFQTYVSSDISQVPLISKVVYYPLVNTLNAVSFNSTALTENSYTLKDILTLTKLNDNSQEVSSLGLVWPKNDGEWNNNDTQKYIFQAVVTDDGGEKFKIVFMMFHDEPYKKVKISNPKEYYSTFRKSPFYYISDDSMVDYANLPHVLTGLRTKREYSFYHDPDVLSHSTIFDLDGNYYSVENGVVKKAYTIKNLMDGQGKGFYKNDVSYTTTCLIDSEFTLSIPIYLNQTTVSKDYKIQTTSVASDENLRVKVKYDIDKNTFSLIDLDTDAKNAEWSNQIQITRTKGDVTYSSSMQISKANNSKTLMLGDLTNGEFWNMFHDKTDSVYAPLMENAAVIETQLEEYWDQAYTASKYCEYFLPEHWQPRVDKSDNYFSSSIYGVEGNSVYLKNKYLPIVKMVTTGNSSSVQGYNMTYTSDMNNYLKTQISNNQTLIVDYAKESNDVNDALSTNGAIAQFRDALQSLQMNNFTQHWILTKNGTRSYYYTFPDGNGTTWVDMLQDLSTKSINYDKFSGLYVMMLNILLTNYKNNPLSTYNELRREHEDYWKELYLKYPGLFLEATYTNEDATNSKELFNFAANYFKKMREPEHNYSITTIDINAINGYHGQPLRIGDPIEIDAAEYHDEADDVKDALSQYLFVSDISYTLRRDDNIQLTVNDIKYEDKLIKSLAKLIR